MSKQLTVDQLDDLIDRADDEIASISKKLVPLREEEAELQKEIDVLTKKIVKLREKIVLIEEPRLRLAKLVIAEQFNRNVTPEKRQQYRKAQIEFATLIPVNLTILLTRK